MLTRLLGKKKQSKADDEAGVNSASINVKFCHLIPCPVKEGFNERDYPYVFLANDYEIPCKVNGVRCSFLIDSGANVGYITYNTAKRAKLLEQVEK